MDLDESSNKTIVHKGNDLTANDDGKFHLSDKAVIITLSSVAVILVVTIALITWRYLNKSRNGDLHIHAVLRDSQRSSQFSTLSRVELSRLLKIYGRTGATTPDNVSQTSANVFVRGGVNRSTSSLGRSFEHSPKRALRRSPYHSPHRVAYNRKDVSISPGVLSRSSERALISPGRGRSRGLMSPAERFRKSSGSSHGTPYRLIHTRSPSILEMESPQNRNRNNSLLSNDSIFTSPLGHYRFQRLFKIGTKPRNPSLVSLSSRGNRENLNLEPCDQKPFYFAWPEEQEEEDHMTAWSPLLMKLAALDAPKEGLAAGDDYALRKAMKVKVQQQSRKPQHVRAAADVAKRPALKLNKRQIQLLTKQQMKKAGQTKLTEKDKRSKQVQKTSKQQQVRSKILQEDKGVVSSKHNIGIPDGMKSTWV